MKKIEELLFLRLDNLQGSLKFFPSSEEISINHRIKLLINDLMRRSLSDDACAKSKESELQTTIGRTYDRCAEVPNEIVLSFCSFIPFDEDKIYSEVVKRIQMSERIELFIRGGCPRSLKEGECLCGYVSNYGGKYCDACGEIKSSRLD